MNDQVEALRRSYDEVPYVSIALPQTAPEHLAAIAALFGVDAPAPATARVLELGCASGGNVVPFAARNPDATVVGIDLSPVQIDAGRRVVDRLGLRNLDLRTGDLATLGDDIGTFDYILCHGVYSWVPAHVQSAILALCGRALTPSGVAFVSYNTYPGWKFREVVRDAMVYWGGSRASPKDRLGYSRAIVDFVAQSARPDSLVARTMAQHADELGTARGDYVLHEYLEGSNHPCYLHDFVDRAQGERLAYLGDAQPAIMFASNLAPDVARRIVAESRNDQVKREQLMDFVVGRTFRQSLLRRAAAPPPRHDMPEDVLRRLHYAGRIACRDGTVRHDSSSQEFEVVPHHRFRLTSAAMKATAEVLFEAWPGTVDAAGIEAGVSARLGPLLPSARREMFEFLALAVRRGLVRLRTRPLAKPPSPGERPVADPVTRLLASMSADMAEPVVPNPWHDPISLDTLDLELLPLLDGSRDRTSLRDELLAAMAGGRLRLARDGVALTGQALVDAAAASVDATLESLWQRMLLTA